METLANRKLPNARILTFGCDAYVADWRGMVSKNRIGNHSMNLLTSLATYREDDDTVRLVGSCWLPEETDTGRMIDLLSLSATAWEVSSVKM